MKMGELSLYLNYKSNLEYIAKNYKEGVFLILESDVMIGKNINMFNKFLTDIKRKGFNFFRFWKKT